MPRLRPFSFTLMTLGHAVNLEHSFEWLRRSRGGGAPLDKNGLGALPQFLPEPPTLPGTSSQLQRSRLTASDVRKRLSTSVRRTMSFRAGTL
jgi:hypothetical protein